MSTKGLLDRKPETTTFSVIPRCRVSRGWFFHGYLKHLALGTLVKEQVLLVERLQGLSCNLGFLFGFASSAIQQVHLDVGRWGRKHVVKGEKQEKRMQWWRRGSGSSGCVYLGGIWSLVWG